jgi:Uma2 family endonuclease
MLYTERRHFTADDLLTLPDDGWRYELVQGRLIQMPPTGVDHGAPTDNLYFAMGQVRTGARLGQSLPGEDRL